VTAPRPTHSGTASNGSRLEAMAREIREGGIPATIYSDPEIFELEKRRLFQRTWFFLAHESEIPDTGDYVVRRIADDSFIVVRDEEGRVRVLFNMCLHRGMQVCRAESGNASHFRCPYHAWTYKNNGQLVGVPFHQDAYGGDAGLRRERASLIPPDRVDIHRGLIFACLDGDAPDLEEHLRDFDFFLDLYVGRSDAGVELRGPQRWLVNANWKIGAENFAGDTYHTPHTHQSVVEVGLFAEPKGHKRKEGALYFAGRGGGTTYKLPPGTFAEKLKYIGYPDPMIEKMRSVWSEEQRALVEDAGFMVSAATLLPNLSFVHNWPQINAEGDAVPFTSIRLWQPISATRTEILSWFVVDRDAPDSFKEASYKAYLMCFGSSGMFEQDDVENWTSITQMAQGSLAGRIRLNNRMGLSTSGELLKEPLASWPAPGTAFVGFGEYNQRALLSLWAEYVPDDGAGNGAAEAALAAHPREA
jgi:phthalate 3,4-dioxygenase subunit alpha